MKKAIASLSLVMLVSSVFALSVQDLETKLDAIYNSGVKSGALIYNNYKTKFINLQNTLQTGDYKILTYFTGIELSPALEQVKQKYSDYVSTITSKKYDILSELTTTQTNFKNGLISTGEYETQLENIEVEISGYNVTIKNELKGLENSYSGLYVSYENKLNTALSLYSGDIQKYKTFEKQLSQLNQAYSGLKADYSQLEKIL